MTVPVLELRSVTKRYGTRPALRGVSFALHRGEAVGYLGPNGAGKTTTLKLVAGLARPDSGEVRLGGLDPIGQRTEALARLGALVETPGVPQYLRPRDLLEYVARARHLAAREVPPAVARAAERCGVGAFLDRPFGTLSTGLARRTLLAAAMVGEPELLVLDEPTLGLDPSARDDLRLLLKALVGGGTTLLVSTHLLEDVEAVCDRVLFLRDGAVVGDEPVRPPSPGAAGGRAVELTFAEDLPDSALASLRVGAVRWTRIGPRSARAEFAGDAHTQADLLAGVVRAGLPLLSATPPTSDLTRRYLERVGREEAA